MNSFLSSSVNVLFVMNGHEISNQFSRFCECILKGLHSSRIVQIVSKNFYFDDKLWGFKTKILFVLFCCTEKFRAKEIAGNQLGGRTDMFRRVFVFP
jgi:hypothetical protein